jgi:branched-subunit amino acid permease
MEICFLVFATAYLLYSGKIEQRVGDIFDKVFVILLGYLVLHSLVHVFLGQ